MSELLELADVQVPEVQVDMLPPDPDDTADDHLEDPTDADTGEDADL